MAIYDVAFVAAGNHGSFENYRSIAEAYKRQLEHFGGTVAGEQRFQCAIFVDIDEAIAHLRDAHDKKILAVLSDAFMDRAAEVAKQHGDMKVLVFTGADQQPGEVQVVRKSWTYSDHDKGIVARFFS